MSDLSPQDALYSPPPSQCVPLSYEEIEWAKRQCRGVKGSCLRAAIEKLLYQPTEVAEEDASIVLASILNSSAWRWRQHNLAMWTLGRMPLSSQKKQRVASALSDFVKQKGLAGFYQVALFWLLFVMTLIAVGAPVNGVEGGWSTFPAVLGACVSAPFVWLTASVWGDLRFNLLRATAVETLGLIALPESAEAIAYAMYEMAYNRKGLFDRRLWRAAIAAFPQALASLTSARYLQMGASFVPNLSHLLDHLKEPLQLDILEALGKMGDGRAVIPIRRFLLRTKSVATSTTAQRILPILERRQAQETAHSTLLRASSKPNDAPNVLLRPAYGGYEDQPQSLLRPVNSAPLLTFDLGEPQDNTAPSDTQDDVQNTPL